MGKKPRPKNVSNQGQPKTPAPTQPATNGNAVAAPSAPSAAESSCVSEAVALVASGKSEYLPEEIYHNERKLLLELQKANTDQHDKAILTLTAGIMGLTITFISNIAPNPPPWTMVWLVLGWGGMVLSMAAMMSSFLTGQWACQRQIQLLDKHAQEGVRPSQKNWMSRLTVCLNVSSHLFFLAGIICIAVFSGLNLLADRTPPTTNSPPSITPGEPMADTQKVPPVTLPSPPLSPPLNPGTGHTPPSSPPVVPAVPPSPPPTKK